MSRRGGNVELGTHLCWSRDVMKLIVFKFARALAMEVTVGQNDYVIEMYYA